MYKIGTGMGGTVAGRVYLNVRSRKEGNVTWAHCQGKLYLRRVGEAHGLVTIIDTMDFRTLGELTLDLEERFKDNKQLLHKNRNYPLLSDGECLYTVVMTIEKRERGIKDENVQMAEALKVLKQTKRETQQKEKQEAKEAKKKKAAEKKKSESGENKEEKSSDKLTRLLLKKKNDEQVESVDFFHGQQYQVVVFKVLKFDLSKKKAPPPQDLEEKKIDFLSMSEQQLFDMPIV